MRGALVFVSVSVVVDSGGGGGDNSEDEDDDVNLISPTRRRKCAQDIGPARCIRANCAGRAQVEHSRGRTKGSLRCWQVASSLTNG